MGKAGRARVLEKFDQQKQIDALVEIYRGLLPEMSRDVRKR